MPAEDGADAFMTLDDACRELGISLATGRNWVKLGKLEPAGRRGKAPVFDASYIASVKSSLETGSIAALKSRRNKRYVSGTGIYGSYLDPSSSGVRAVSATLERMEGIHAEITEELIRALLADAAVQMLSAQNGKCMHLQEFISRRTDMTEDSLPCASLVSDLLEGFHAEDFILMHPELFDVQYAADGNNDVLGLLYLSLRGAGSRKANGAYYTPARLVDALVSGLDEKRLENARILDPCCGTGNFLLRLPDSVPLENVRGNDLDAVGVMTARINLALKHKVRNPEILYRNITVSDYLTDYDGPEPDCIIGNPPWGYEFTPDETAVLDRMYSSACGTKTESYDLFIEKSLKALKPGGVMSFVLPEAVLNVKSHAEIRRIILESSEIQFVSYEGNAFHGVQCPCVIFSAKRSTGGTPKDPETGEYVCSGIRTAPLEGEPFFCDRRLMSAESLSFHMNNVEYAVLEKIESVPDAAYLKGNAVFALGIVTGGNKSGVSSVKTDSNEMVLRGPDLRKFRFVSSGSYITFTPEKFQQAATEEYYRVPEKLLYRFICSQLVFAYDNRGTLSLNSCNILIPKIPGMSCKYVMAVLNSRMAQFWFKGRCNSVKVLRSHIERIPIPYADETTQRAAEELADRICSANGEEEILALYDELDGIIKGLYCLTDEEYSVVRRVTDRENLFL
ncbi:MAG: N-6 DNA methylase, partial [Clostridia bacterium]|nr:N-6 DNA methylase [Clostridia bacterium]